MSTAGSDSIRARYSRREVIYLIGGSDDGGTTDCQSMPQGNHRYERSIIYFNYLQYYFGPEILERHQHAIIPNIDHDSYNVFNSACGRKALFGYGNCNQLDFLNVIDTQVLEGYKLTKNYPNPFNASTTIEYQIPNKGAVKMVIYDLMGRIVKEIKIQNQFPGHGSINWDGKDQFGAEVGSGVYLYHLIYNGRIMGKNKMILLK